MALFTARERRALGDPGAPLIPDRPTAWTTAGVPVTTDTAMTLAAVWACVRLRADLVSTLPIDVYRRNSAGVQINIPAPKILVNPSGDRMDIGEWLYASQMSLDLRGNAYGRIVARDGLQYPTQIELIHPDFVQVRMDQVTGALTYLFYGKQVPTPDVWHERQNILPGVPVGLSPITYMARTIGVSLAAEKFGADWFSDGAHPSSILSTDQKIDGPQAVTIKQRFIAAVRNTREPVVLGSGFKYQAIQVSPNESQFLETMRWGVEQVCRAFSTPPAMIGAAAHGSSVTYQNVEQQGIDYLTYHFGPTIARRERSLSKLTPNGQFVKFNADALLRTDLLTRYKAHAIGIAAHFLLDDEAREMEDRPPLTDQQRAQLDAIPLTVTPTGAVKSTDGLHPVPQADVVPADEEPK